MSETMYITGVVIANGIPDSDGDVLDKKDIKTIYTKFLDQSSDILHDRIKHEKIYVLGNWITGVDVEIAGKIAPAGSWLTTLAVDNEEIKTAVNNKELRGLSLGSVSEDALTREKWFINKVMSYKRILGSLVEDEPEQKTYSDLDDIEEVHPFWISIVDNPANQFGFEVDNYTAFINKRASEEVDTMANEKDLTDRISIQGWGKITDIFRKENSINKSEEETKPVENSTENKSDDISNKELLEAMPNIIAEGFKIALNEMKSSEQNEEDIDKSETAEDTDNDESKETKEETEDSKEEDSGIDKSKEGKADYIDETGIDKRQTRMPNPTNSVPSSSDYDFYKRTGRDAMGRKIR